MTDRYQFARPDDRPRDWTPGKTQFEDMWGFARDRLRFHKGAGFQIKVSDDGIWSAKRSLADTADRLRALLDDQAEDTVIYVRSLKDQWGVAFRRHQVSADLGLLMLAEAASRHGIPYDFGFTDCSWLTRECVAAVTDDTVLLPHNAHAQHLLTSVVKPITRDLLKPGDLVFIHDDDHVAIWIGPMDGYPGGPVVWDTQPHDTGSPSGWPTQNLGTGVRIRPAFGGYYCASINACGRIPQINGAP